MDLPSTSSNGGGEEAVGSEGVAKKDELVRVIIEISLLILEYKFSKLLSGGKLKEASKTLRHEIVPLVNSDEIVRKNFSLIVSPSQNLLNGAPGRESGLKSFKKIKEDLRNFLSPMVMIPEKRSFSHVEQPLDFRCNYGSSLAREASLVISHHRGRDEASKHIQTSMGFGDEVWFVQFSRDGKYLAAASGTAVCICEVLEYGGFLFLPTLVGHRQPVSYITWSPTNNLHLLTCGVEETVKRWIIAPIGCCLHTYAKRGLGMVSCVWAPDGQSIFTGLNNGSIIMWNLQGDELRSWEGTKTTRIADLVITRDGRELITTCEEDTILLFNWESGSERYIDEDGAIVSLSLSEDSTLLLVSMSYALIHLWDIGLETPQMVTFFDGHKRQRFVVRACFCGANPLVVASGSEDSKVYISEYETEEHRTLAGHSAVVNCVSSNPTDPRMLASGSDDRTIRLWRY